jgi:MinD superfamily P-loop ATPase
MVPRIDVFRCDGCAICVKHCPPKVMGMVQNKAVILVDLCEECGICFEACPIDAIHFRLPNQGVNRTHEAYQVVREFTPNPGNWRVGTPLGVDGEGNPK